jgi:hypothetical protein
VSHPSTSCSWPRELAFRSFGGVEVALLWRRDDDELTVAVVDLNAASSFAIAVHGADPMDVFHHPFVYAAAGAGLGFELCELQPVAVEVSD